MGTQGMYWQGLQSGANLAQSAAATTLSEESTRSDRERVVHDVDPATSSNDLGCNRAPIKDILLSGASHRRLCGRRQKQQPEFGDERAAQAQPGSHRLARHAAA
eukprot:1084967-Prymnesium_polylepis.1